MKKGCLIGALVAGGVAVFIGIIVSIVIFVFAITGGAAEAANEFLAKIGEGEISEAYRMTTPSFQASQTEDDFRREVRRLGLDNYASSSWPSRQIDTAKATLEGAVKTRDGDKIPLTVLLVKVDDVWRVLSMKGPRPGLSTVEDFSAKKERGAIPREAELRKMARESVLALNQAVRDEDFTAFYNSIAELWQKEVTPEKLKEFFQVFIDNKVKMDGVRKVDPVFEKDPGFESRGFLELEGHYPTTPYQTRFNLKYHLENGQWKLVGIHVNLVKKDEDTKLF